MYTLILARSARHILPVLKFILDIHVMVKPVKKVPTDQRHMTVLRAEVYVVVNFLSQVIFIFLLFKLH